MSAASPVIIGITTRHRNPEGNYPLSGRYVDAVRQAGGIPVLLPPGEDPAHLSTVLDWVDGLIFSGGGDICPTVYGGEGHEIILFVSAERDQFEVRLAQLGLAAGVPMLGICRGLQVFAVAEGVGLYPHLPDQYGTTVHHVTPEDKQPIRHPVQIVPGTRLARILQTTELAAISWHHQAIRELPAGWRIAAQTADGVIEAIEQEQDPGAIAIQWHPEYSLGEAVHRRLFEAFIAQVIEHKQGIGSSQPSSLHPALRL